MCEQCHLNRRRWHGEGATPRFPLPLAQHLPALLFPSALPALLLPTSTRVVYHRTIHAPYHCFPRCQRRRHLFTGVARAHASCTASTGRAYAMPTSASAPTSAPSTAAASASSAAADPPADHSQADPRTLFLDADQTSRYAAHRPHYPPQLYDLLYTHAFPGRHPTPGPPFPDLAVADVATGSGQALGPMPEHFGRCVALDVSPAQLQVGYGAGPCAGPAGARLGLGRELTAAISCNRWWGLFSLLHNTQSWMRIRAVCSLCNL